MRESFTRWEELACFLELTPFQEEQILKLSHFPLLFPRRLAEKVEKGCLNDPILKQYLPIKEEEKASSGFSKSPLQEELFRPCKRLLKKYHSRALLLPTSACAMNCRYCFRRSFPYEKEESSLDEELSFLAKETSIKEVILSGGDPLSLSNQALSNLENRIAKIPHIEILRFHSKLPLGIPERIDEGFLEICEKSRLKVVFVLHCNHPKELDQDIFNSLNKLAKAGATLLSQSVLLKGVNNSEETLSKLFLSLISSGVIPYYLHQLDPVEGAAHFLVPVEEGKALVESLRKKLPGYATPRFVQEIPQRPYKTILY